jgi:hypothetical protein
MKIEVEQVDLVYKLVVVVVVTRVVSLLSLIFSQTVSVVRTFLPSHALTNQPTRYLTILSPAQKTNNKIVRFVTVLCQYRDSK